jgi:predicted small lipoprotein YifL
MKRRSHFNALIAATLIGGFALSSCGIRGELKTPPPVWGEDVRSAEQKAEDAKKGKSGSGIVIQAPEPVE